jgi:hypothetical protein
MHLTEIIQNVIDSESRGEHVMEPAPTPTPTPARHKSSVVESSPEPTPRKKRKLSPPGRKGTHERPIDIDSSDDDDEEDYEKAVKVKEGDSSDEVKPMLHPDLESGQILREGSIAGKGTGGDVSRLARKEMKVPVTIIDPRTSSESNPIRNHTPTSLDQQYADHGAGPEITSATITPSPSNSTSSSSSSSGHEPKFQSLNGYKGDTADVSASAIPPSNRHPEAKLSKSASISSTKHITPLSHAMLASIHGKLQSGPRPTKLPSQQDRGTHSGPANQSNSPISTDVPLPDKGNHKTAGRKDSQSGWALVDEDAAESRRRRTESRCQSPVDTSALRRQHQAAITETCDSCTISPIAATKELILHATSSTPVPTTHQTHLPLDLSGISADTGERNIPQTSGSSSSNPTETMTSIIPTNPSSRTFTDTSSTPDMVDGYLRTPHSAAVLRKGAMGSGTSAGPVPHSTPTPAQSITRAPSRTSSAPASIDRTHKPNSPIVSTIPPLHPSLPPKPSTLSRDQEYSALELSQFQTVLDNNGAEHRWLTIKRGFRSHDLRFSVTAETRAGLISQVFKNRGWLEGVYGSQPTNVGLYLDGKVWLPSFTVQQIGLWGLLAPGTSRSYLIEVELTYSSVMHA